MPAKVCCVTGHRIIPAEQLDRIEVELRGLIQRAIDAGYDAFLSGFADGTDLIFARLVLGFQDDYPVQLEAAIPYAGRLKCNDPEFQTLLTKCIDVSVLNEQYNPSCFFERNRYMVDRANSVIAVYDGRRRGGTYQTIRYAEEVGKQVAFVCICP